MLLTRTVERPDAAERRLFATQVRGWTPPSTIFASGEGTKRGPKEAAAAVHAAHAAAMDAARASREAQAAGSDGQMLKLDDAIDDASGAVPPPSEADSDDTARDQAIAGIDWDEMLHAKSTVNLAAGVDEAALSLHRAECRNLLEVIRGWDVRGKAKLDRPRFEFQLASLDPHVRVEPTLLTSILDHCEGREVDVIDMRLFCETLALPCNVGLVHFSGELVPNARRGLRSTKELPIGSNPLGPPAQPAPWAEPYGDGSTANVKLSLRFGSPETHLKKVEDEVRSRDRGHTGEISRAAFAEALNSMSLRLFLSEKEMDQLVREADKTPSGAISIDRFFEAAAYELREKGQLPALLMQKQHRSPDMHQSLNWSVDERFTESEGKYELKRWMRTLVPFGKG